MTGVIRSKDMAVDIVMPQMGESIFEGTITKWLKKPGDKVERDEPLFEISTDKVDAEIPSPSAGVLKEIKVGEDCGCCASAHAGPGSGESPSTCSGSCQSSCRRAGASSCAQACCAGSSFRPTGASRWRSHP